MGSLPCSFLLHGLPSNILARRLTFEPSTTAMKSARGACLHSQVHAASGGAGGPGRAGGAGPGAGELAHGAALEPVPPRPATHAIWAVLNPMDEASLKARETMYLRHTVYTPPALQNFELYNSETNSTFDILQLRESKTLLDTLSRVYEIVFRHCIAYE